jgi:hypothetical protein
MRNHSTILRSRLIATNAPNHHPIRARAASRIRAARLDGELQVWSRAGEGEALVIFVLVGVAVFTDGFAGGIVGECCCGGVVDVYLAIDCPCSSLVSLGDRMRLLRWVEEWCDQRGEKEVLPSQSELSGSSEIV